MRLYVVTARGREVATLSVEPTCTVGSVLQLLPLTDEVRADVRLRYGGNELDCSAELSAVGVCDGAELVVELHRRRWCVITASGDGTAKLWSVQSRKCYQTFAGHDGPLNSACLSPDGTMVLTTSQDLTAKLWSVATGHCTYTLRAHRAGLFAASFNHSGDLAMTGSADCTACLWSVSSGALLQTFQGHGGVVYCVSFLPGGHSAVTAADDGCVGVWVLATGECVQMGHMGRAIIYTVPSGLASESVLVGGADCQAKLWSAESSQCLEGLQTCKHAVFAAALSLDAASVLFLRKRDRIGCGPSSPDAPHTLHCHRGILWSVVFSQSQTLLLTVTADGLARIWSAETETVLVDLKGCISTGMFSPDGRWVLTASSDGTAKLWCATSGKHVGTFEGHQGAVTAGSFGWAAAPCSRAAVKEPHTGHGVRGSPSA